MSRNPMNRIGMVAIGAMAFVSAALSAQVQKQSFAQQRAQNLMAPTSRTVGSSRNGGQRGGNMSAIRASRKRRNQLRHRKACRG